MVAIIDNINSTVNDSFVGRFFEMKERNTNFTTELRGATATFLTMSYILAVNPRILADSGGPCVPGEGGIFAPEYEMCLQNITKQYVTATALCSMVGCLTMGLLANLPIALSTGMGLNAYFTYSVVGFRGTGPVAYDAAITAVLIEGIIFLVLAVTGVRFFLVKLIPEPVKLATPAAIGAFLAHLGLQTAEGVGMVVSDIATAVTLGGCPEEKRVSIVAYTEACETLGICVKSDAYTCDDLGGIMTSGTMWLGILGFMIMVVLMAYKRNSSMIIGIAFVTFISWFRDTAVTYFPDNDSGNARFEYFQQIVTVEPMDMITAQYTGDLKKAGLSLFTFLYVDFLDTSGTLYALVSSMGYIDEDGNFPRSRQAFAADAISTIFGSIFGCSPVTSYIESAAGVEAGSKTGLTAVICAFYFFISIFFAPILANIPPWATGGSLVIVGSLMCRSLVKIKWYDPSHAVTAFITIMIMPLTYSIGYGLIAGMGCYFFLEGTFFLLSLVGIEKPVHLPPKEENVKEVKELDVKEGDVESDNDKEVEVA
mmetsp:Transcript_4894/g.5962  ORF Transcript_4894/g.5962 Transcript_4894/m.5962 type:complete len:539 (+) Transcript_4894:90-1706(+)